MLTLHRFLVDYDIAMLRALAQARGLALDTNRQKEAADLLAEALLEPESVAQAMARLSAEARAGLERLLAAGGRMRVAHFTRQFGEIRPMGPGRLEREAAWQNPASPAEELLYGGLLFRAFYQDEAGPGEFVVVPEELWPLLPEPAPPPAFAVEIAAGPGMPVGGRRLADDLFGYLVYVQTHTVRPYADGRLTRRDVEALHRQMGRPPARRLALAAHLAAGLGMVGRSEVLRLHPAAAKTWLTASPERRAAILSEAWRDDPTWNDLCQVPGLICDEGTGWLLRYDAAAARKAVLELLARCPRDEWWAADSFVAAVKRAAPDFQRPDGDYESWYIRDAAGGEYLSGFAAWDRVEGALIADLLAGPLFWLEIVDAVPGPAGTVCRLTAAGRRFLGLEAGEPAAAPSAPIVVRPDFAVEVPDPAAFYVRFQLERFAELESAEPCRYRLTLPALHRALGRGLRADQVLAFLAQTSGGPVPLNVAGQLRLWAGRFGQVRLEEVALLRTKDERVMKELHALPRTRPLIDRLLSPTTALVRKRHLARLEKELRELGYLSPGEGVDEE